MKPTAIRLSIAVVFTLISGLALAQDTASLTGTIRDPSGAVIIGAAVRVKNSATGLVRELRTNSAGEYLAAAVPPGHYEITVTAPGFRRYQAQNVTFRVAQDARY